MFVSEGQFVHSLGLYVKGQRHSTQGYLTHRNGSELSKSSQYGIAVLPKNMVREDTRVADYRISASYTPICAQVSVHFSMEECMEVRK
jgi:hypothetical protein